MNLFNKLDQSIFLKECSELKNYILKLEELYEKSDGDLKNKLERELKIAKLGDIGERNIAFELKNSNIPMYVIHDINLEVDGLEAQIDYIVVTKKVTFIIECKNLIGNIEIDSNGNFIRTYKLNNRFIKEGFYSPIAQNQRHLDVLRGLIKENKSNFLTKMLFEKYFNDNYKSVVVLANPKTVLNNRYAKKEVKEKVIRADQLIDFIKKANSKDDAIPMSDSNLKSKADKILSWHNPSKMSYLKKYKGFLDEYKLYSKDKIKNFNNINNRVNKEDLIKKLKEFRLNTSKCENIKPYIIFNDNQMMNLIDCMPKNKEELKYVSGFGEVKVNKYGDEIIKILNCYS